MITFTALASTRRTSRTLNSCSRPNNTDVRPYFDTGCPADVSLFRRRQHHGRVWETCEDRAGIRPSSVAAPPATERVTSGTALARRGSSRWTHGTGRWALRAL
jgi:hypothetical protein